MWAFVVGMVAWGGGPGPLTADQLSDYRPTDPLAHQILEDPELEQIVSEAPESLPTVLLVDLAVRGPDPMLRERARRALQSAGDDRGNEVFTSIDGVQRYRRGQSLVWAEPAMQARIERLPLAHEQIAQLTHELMAWRFEDPRVTDTLIERLAPQIRALGMPQTDEEWIHLWSAVSTSDAVRASVVDLRRAGDLVAELDRIEALENALWDADAPALAALTLQAPRLLRRRASLALEQDVDRVLAERAVLEAWRFSGERGVVPWTEAPQMPDLPFRGVEGQQLSRELLDWLAVAFTAEDRAAWLELLARPGIRDHVRWAQVRGHARGLLGDFLDADRRDQGRANDCHRGLEAAMTWHARPPGRIGIDGWLLWWADREGMPATRRLLRSENLASVPHLKHLLITAQRET